MGDPAVIHDMPANAKTDSEHHDAHEPDEQFDARLRRLEAAIVAMQDTRLMEERLIERVHKRLETNPLPSAATGVLIDAGKNLLPTAMRALNEATAPAGYVPVSTGSKGWIPLELLTEFRTFWNMVLDFRFHVSWTAKLVPLAALSIAVISWIFFRGVVPILCPIVDYMLWMFLTVVVYKTWLREANRYREQTYYLPPRG
jgi:hypothetical protein